MKEVNNLLVTEVSNFINSKYYDDNFWDKAKSKVNIFADKWIAKVGLKKLMLDLSPKQLIRLIDRDDVKCFLSKLDTGKENGKKIIEKFVDGWRKIDNTEKKGRIAGILIECNSVFKDRLENIILENVNTKINLSVGSEDVKKTEVSLLNKKREKSQNEKDEDEHNDLELKNGKNKKPKLDGDKNKVEDKNKCEMEY